MVISVFSHVDVAFVTPFLSPAKDTEESSMQLRLCLQFYVLFKSNLSIIRRKSVVGQIIPVLYNPVSLPSNISTLITVTNHQDSMVKFFTAALLLIIDA